MISVPIVSGDKQRPRLPRLFDLFEVEIYLAVRNSNALQVFQPLCRYLFQYLTLFVANIKEVSPRKRKTVKLLSGTLVLSCNKLCPSSVHEAEVLSMATGLGRLAFAIGGCPLRTLQNFPKPLVYRNFSQRVKRRRQTVAKTSVDIDGILSSTSTKKVPTAATNDPASVSPKDEVLKTWQASEERTNLLKQGERRVAIIAVVTMLIAFGVIKLMVYGADKKRKSEAVEQPA